MQSFYRKHEENGYYESLTPQASDDSETYSFESPTKTLPSYIHKQLYNQTKKTVKYLDSDESFNNIFELLAPKNSRGTDEKKRSNRAFIHEAINRHTNLRYIVKIIDKSKLPESAGGESIWKILCSRLLNISSQHNNVMTVYDIYESNNYFYLVCEHLKGGELFEYLIEERAIPEELCKYIIKQILESLHFLHSNRLLHRDLKPENLMFRRARPNIDDSDLSSADSYSAVKPRQMNSLECSQKMSLQELSRAYELAVIDFDTCRLTDICVQDYQEVKNGRRRLVGTYGYLAPEVLRGHEYTFASDLWSVGVILYILITGVPPVPMNLMTSARSSLEVLMQLKKRGFNFDLAPFSSFPKAQHLCRKLLEFDVTKRLKTAQQALEHPWLYLISTYTIPLYKYPLMEHPIQPYSVNRQKTNQKNNKIYSAINVPCSKLNYSLNYYMGEY